MLWNPWSGDVRWFRSYYFCAVSHAARFCCRRRARSLRLVVKIGWAAVHACTAPCGTHAKKHPRVRLGLCHQAAGGIETDRQAGRQTERRTSRTAGSKSGQAETAGAPSTAWAARRAEAIAACLRAASQTLSTSL